MISTTMSRHLQKKNCLINQHIHTLMHIYMNSIHSEMIIIIKKCVHSMLMLEMWCDFILAEM